MKFVTEMKIGEEFITPFYSRTPGCRAIAKNIVPFVGPNGASVLQITAEIVSGHPEAQPGDYMIWFPLLEWHYLTPKDASK